MTVALSLMRSLKENRVSVVVMNCSSGTTSVPCEDLTIPRFLDSRADSSAAVGAVAVAVGLSEASEDSLAVCCC